MSRTIQSPGVEIREKDLSLRVQTPTGTTLLIPGFASQGPTNEPILITTISEFEQVFGQPGTMAEKYLYYSMKEAVTTSATVYTIRLPYGGEGGAGWTNSYNALFYPMSSTSFGWEVQKPINVTLNLSQYNDLLRGNYTWKSVSDSTTSLTNTGKLSSLYDPAATSGEVEVGAGFFILNTLQTSVDEIGQGYYVGISTNADADPTASANFESIRNLTSLNSLSASTAYGNYFNINPERLDFRLSATKLESDRGVTSISETLEKVGFSAYEGEEYKDYLSFGVYKIRSSISDPNALSLASVEQYLGSLDNNKKKASPVGGVLETAYIEDLVNNASGSIKIYIHPSINSYGWTTGGLEGDFTYKQVKIKDEAKALYAAGTYAPNTGAVEQSKQIGNVPLKLQRGILLATNTETYTIDVIVDAGLSTIHAYTAYSAASGLGNFNDEITPVLSATVADPAQGSVLDNWTAVALQLQDFANSARKDCIAIIDPIRSNFVSGKNTKVMDVLGNNFTEHVYNPLKQQFDSLDSNYATAYGNWIKVNDVFTNRKFWLPFSAYAGAVIARSDAAANPWAAPAGFTRGGFANALDIAFNANQKQRDRLYDIPVNPVVFFAGDGYAIYGQKTLQNRPTAFDRLNVRRLFLALERAVSKTIRYFVFEPNTSITRNRILSTLSPIFNYAKNTEGLYDYVIVCDERNNSPDTIDNGELVVDIYIKPVRTAEFILVNFIATRTGQNFSELI
jgi:phage tail sheath protein FI